MVQKLFSTEQYNRREFVVTAGLIVAGGIVGCTRQEDSTEQNTSETKVLPTPDQETPSVLAVPTEPIVIRVRIGRVRDSGGATVGETYIQRLDDTWNIEGSTSGYWETDLTLAFEAVVDRTIRVGRQTKNVSSQIVAHPREDISRTAFDVVANIPLETYLPGVLAGELYSHWHRSTYAAQAVAARSYAVAEHLQRINTSHYDVSDGPSSQMFIGNVTLESAHRGVNETRGTVLSWENRIIPAYYSACCGGIPATASDEISSATQHDIPPLQGHDGTDVCTTLDIHTWSIQRHSRTFRRRINACAISMNTPSFGDIHSIQLIETAKTNHHGRPNELAIIDRRDNAFNIRTRDFVRAVNARFPSLPNPSPTIWSSFLTGHKIGRQLQFSGMGIGHGVGLCQYGAQELSERGRSWEEVLSWYYPNADVTTLSGT